MLTTAVMSSVCLKVYEVIILTTAVMSIVCLKVYEVIIL